MYCAASVKMGSSRRSPRTKFERFCPGRNRPFVSPGYWHGDFVRKETLVKASGQLLLIELQDEVMKHYNNQSIVFDQADLEAILAAHGGGPHYVYILRYPDGIECYGGFGTPFYVGLGQGLRVFAHEKEASDPKNSSAKVEAIRSIWEQGQQIIRTLDSVHDQEPWDREEELINEIGRLAEGRGPLTNDQTYSPSTKINGVELRKYAGNHIDSGDVTAIPQTFKLRNERLKVGPREPKIRTSVMGKIYTVLEDNPGVTGEELVHLLLHVDFSRNKSPYTQGGGVSASWLVGYIEGGYFRKDHLIFQKFVNR